MLLLRCYCREPTPEGSREHIVDPRISNLFRKNLFKMNPIFYTFMCSSHPVNDLLDGVQADDARAFLIGSRIPGFTLCTGKKLTKWKCPVGGKNEQKSKTDKGKQTGFAPIRHPCVCTCRVQQMELLKAELESGEDNWTAEATNKEGISPTHALVRMDFQKQS